MCLCPLIRLYTIQIFRVLQVTYRTPRLTFAFKEPERLKSRKRRPEVNRLDGQWARWLLGLMFDRLNCR